jgi:hypothetical protein
MSIVLIMSLCLVGTDFPICTATNSQFYPKVLCANDQYYVFWSDRRYYEVDTSYAVFGARVALDGTVIDPNGKELFKRQAAYVPAAAYDGTNFLVVYRDSC